MPDLRTLPGNNTATVNGTTQVVLLAAPTDERIRYVIKQISGVNLEGATRALTISINRGGVRSQIGLHTVGDTYTWFSPSFFSTGPPGPPAEFWIVLTHNDSSLDMVMNTTGTTSTVTVFYEVWEAIP